MLVRLGRRVGGVSGGAIRPWLAPWLSAPDGADSVRLGGGDDISGARGFRGGPGAAPGLGGRATARTLAPEPMLPRSYSGIVDYASRLFQALNPAATTAPETPVVVLDDANREHDGSDDATTSTFADPTVHDSVATKRARRSRGRRDDAKPPGSELRWPKDMGDRPKVGDLLRRRGLFTRTGAYANLWPRRILEALRRCGEERAQAERWDEDALLWLLMEGRKHPIGDKHGDYRRGKASDEHAAMKDGQKDEYVAMLSLYADADASPLELAKKLGSKKVNYAVRQLPMGWTALAFRERSGGTLQPIPDSWPASSITKRTKGGYSTGLPVEPVYRPVLTERLRSNRTTRGVKVNQNDMTGQNLTARYRLNAFSKLTEITGLWGKIARTHGFVPAPACTVVGAYANVALAADACVALSRHVTLDDDKRGEDAVADDETNPPQALMIRKLTEPFKPMSPAALDGAVRNIQDAVRGWHDMATLWGPNTHRSSRNGPTESHAGKPYFAMVRPVELTVMTNAFLHFVAVDLDPDEAAVRTWARLNSLWSRCSRAPTHSTYAFQCFEDQGQQFLPTALTSHTSLRHSAREVTKNCAVTTHPSGKQITVRKTDALNALLDATCAMRDGALATDILDGAAASYGHRYFGNYAYPAGADAIRSHVASIADHVGSLAAGGALEPEDAVRCLASLAQFHEGAGMSGKDTTATAAAWGSIMDVVADAAASDALTASDLARSLHSWGKYLETYPGDASEVGGKTALGGDDLRRLNALVDAFARSIGDASTDDLHGAALAFDRFIDRYNAHTLVFTDDGESVRVIAREATARIVPAMARDAPRRKDAHEFVKITHRGFGRKLTELPQFRKSPITPELKLAMNHVRDRLALHGAACVDAWMLQAYTMQFMGEDASGEAPPTIDEYARRSRAVAAAAKDGLLPDVFLARTLRAWGRARVATMGGLRAAEEDVVAVHEALESSDDGGGGLDEETVRTLEEAEALFQRAMDIESNGTLAEWVTPPRETSPRVVESVDEEQEEEEAVVEEREGILDAAMDEAFEAAKEDWLARLPKTKASKLLEVIDACADDREVLEAVMASAEEDATKVRASARARVLEAAAKLRDVRLYN